MSNPNPTSISTAVAILSASLIPIIIPFFNFIFISYIRENKYSRVSGTE